MIVIIDPGHGMSNKRRGVYDPGACSGNATEADIAMEWATELRTILVKRFTVAVRTRIDSKDPAPVGHRAAIAKKFKGDIMVSIHCNAANGKASGTETFYRGDSNKDLAAKLNLAVVNALGTKNRGAKTENESQHASLAIMAFQPCFLIELGFISNDGDRLAMLSAAGRKAACIALADVLLGGDHG